MDIGDFLCFSRGVAFPKKRKPLVFTQEELEKLQAIRKARSQQRRAVRAVKPANTVVDRKFPNALYGEAKGDSVCFIVKPVGEPDAANPHVQFDERGWETGCWP